MLRAVPSISSVLEIATGCFEHLLLHVVAVLAEFDGVGGQRTRDSALDRRTVEVRVIR